MIISETTDEGFPVYQFKIGGFNTPFRVDMDQKGGGIMLYFREDLPAKLLSIDRTNESCFVDLNLKCTRSSRSEVFLVSCSENVQQIYRITPMPKCDFNKVALQLY